MDKKQFFKDHFTPEPVKFILNRPEEKEELTKYLDSIKNYVKNVSNIISTRQLRNIFTEISKIKATKEGINNLELLRIKLAYIAGRSETNNKQKNNVIRDFYSNLDELIKNVHTTNDLEIFKDFFEAIIAYHKYFKPNEN
jgi:CRISPR-associated protein Csm2